MGVCGGSWWFVVAGIDDKFLIIRYKTCSVNNGSWKAWLGLVS